MLWGHYTLSFWNTLCNHHGAFSANSEQEVNQAMYVYGSAP